MSWAFACLVLAISPWKMSPTVASVCQRSALRSRHRRRWRHRHCLRWSCHHVCILAQTPIDVFSGDGCMKDTKLMRKNARFRWSSEQGGDLFTTTLNFRVAAVVNIVIRHCRAGRRSVQHKTDFQRATPRRLWEARIIPLWGTHSTKPVVPDFSESGTGTGERPPISANRGRGRGSVPAPGKSGTEVPSPSPDKSGTGTGTGIGGSGPCSVH